MEIPEGYRRIEGSERQVAPEARLVGSADPNETFSVTIIVRRRPDGPPMPDLHHWSKTPPGQRKFLSQEEFAARHGAAQADLDAVANFAHGHGMTLVEISVARRAAVIAGTVAQMSRAFAVELSRYESPTEKYRGRAGYIHIPADLANIVEGVFGLDNRRIGGRHNGDRARMAGDTMLLTPRQVARLYNFPNGDGTGQLIRIFGLNGGYLMDDINTFFFQNPPNVTGVGQNNPPDQPGADLGACSEVLQDICIAGSVAPGAQIQVYFAPPARAGDVPNQDSWVTTIGHMVHDSPTPSVISISFHLASGDDRQTYEIEGVSKDHIDAIHTFFQDAMAMGTTVLVSSGDSGSSRIPPDVKAHVGYPASDPLVTSCGGTAISNINGQTFDEVTWNDSDNPIKPSASGGGISYFYDVPAYQEADVIGGTIVPPSANPDNPPRRGRGVPDVAGNASEKSGYLMRMTTNAGPMTFIASGTSAVAPLYAGLTTLINANLSQNVGFLNPTLYLWAPGRTPFPRPPFPFRDITDGNNQLKGVLNPFYTAGPGWDACTGWGSINGSTLLDTLKQLTREYGWAWCRKCQGLFFSGFESPVPTHPHGICPADGREHDASLSGPYGVVLGDGDGRAQEAGWRRCRKCQGFFFALHSTLGVCPADKQQHEAAGGADGSPIHYAAIHGDDKPGQQGNWRWCNKCEGIFFALDPTVGSCPKDHLPHDPTGSADYAITQ
jgi:kumamolisin